MKRNFKEITAAHSLAYIAKRHFSKYGYNDLYATLKILYFAELKHLVKYGRLITDDQIYAHEHGPVPDSSYSLFKNSIYFKMNGKREFKTLIDLDLDELSESEIECLNQSIEENLHLGFNDLKKKSHGEAYSRVENNSNKFIPLSYLLEQEGLPENKVEYIKEHYEFLDLIECLNR